MIRKIILAAVVAIVFSSCDTSPSVVPCDGCIPSTQGEPTAAIYYYGPDCYEPPYLYDAEWCDWYDDGTICCVWYSDGWYEEFCQWENDFCWEYVATW